MQTSRPRRFELADGLAWAALALGVAARVAGAWATRAIAEPDPAVVALMARHMAALEALPVFFYGQAYMGSLEPMGSALMVRLLGSTGFAVNLGPVLFAAAALFFLWRWARDAAGPWGGFAGALAGLFGPLAYFQFQFAPRGGYMVALFVDALALFAAARLAARLRAGEEVGWGRYFALGLLAGIGMWSNMIVVSALAVAALLLLHGMRWTFWRHAAGVAAGLAGFFAGFSPWLAWNARHGWASLAMSQIGGHAPLREALRNSWNRLLLLQDAGQLGVDSRGPLILAATVLVLAALGAGAAFARRRAASLGENYARTAAVLFCAIFAFVFATSGFTRTHTPRYWIPWVPGLVVLASVACGASGSRRRRSLAWVLLVVLVLQQGQLVVAALSALNARAEPTLAAYRKIGAALEEAGADSLLAPLRSFPLNFALEERFAVSNGRQRFYEPILRRAELSDAPAYASDYNGIGSFLIQQGAEFETIAAGGREILWNVRRSPIALREIPGDRTESLRDAAGADWKRILSDRNLDTVWSPVSQTASSLEWRFVQPQDVHSVQLTFAHSMLEAAFDFPRRVRVEVEIDGAWRTLLADEPVIPLEWSGPRVYCTAGLARPDYRVEAEGAQALRVTLLDTRSDGGSSGWRLAEVSLLESDGVVRRHTTVAVEALGKWLRTQAPEAVVYAPRWISNQLLTERTVPETRLAGLAANIFSAGDIPRDGTVAAGRPCVFIVEPRHADATRQTLQTIGADFRFETVETWSVFSVAAAGGGVVPTDLPPAAKWTGESLLLGNSTARVAEALRRLRAGGTSEETRKALLGEIVRWRPSALSALPEVEVARLGGEAAAQTRRESAPFPAKPCATEFANGVRLEGFEVAPRETKGGGAVEVRLFWSAAADFEPGQEVVFIHLRDAHGKIVAQDDYRGSALLWGDASLRPVPGEWIAETRRIDIPASAPSGPLSLAVGLFQPSNGRRVNVRRTEAPAVRRNAVLFPGGLQVVDGL